MSNFTAHFKSGLYYGFNTVTDLIKISKNIKNDTVESVYLNPILDGNLSKTTYGFLSLFNDLAIDVIVRLENGEFNPILDEMDGIPPMPFIKGTSIPASNDDYNK